MNKIRLYLQALAIIILMCSCKNLPKHSNDTNVKNTGNSLSIGVDNNKYKNHLQPEIGKKYFYNITTETQTKIEVNDNITETLNKSEIGITDEILSDSAGNMVLQLTYNKLHIVLQKTDKEDQVLDADKPTEEQTEVERILSSIKGRSILLKLSSTGEIISTSGSKEIADKVLGKIAIGDVQMRQMVQQLLNKLTGEDFVKENFKEGFKLFPDTAVYVGDSWSHKTLQSSEIQIIADSKYTLTSIEDNTALLDVAGKINTDKNQTANIMGQQVITDLHGEQTGSFKTDIITGMLQFGKTNISLKGTIQVVGREVPITIKINKKIILQE